MRLPIVVLVAALLLAAGGISPLDRVPATEAARANPYDGRDTARRAGAKLFHLHCASCHGDGAEGRDHAPSLATARVHSATPGSLFWVLRNGSLGAGMPSFSHLPDQQRWQVVTYLKSLSGPPAKE